MKIYKIAKKKEKKEKKELTPKERTQVKDKFGNNLGCSFFKDEDGYFCTTHRARSDSYESINKIPKSAVSFIESTSAVTSKIIKTATVDQDIRSLKNDMKKMERTIKDLETKNKKLISDLNLGDRRFWQQKTVFTSLQRKIEKFDKMTNEWDKFKSEMESKMKKFIEKKHRASIQ